MIKGTDYKQEFDLQNTVEENPELINLPGMEEGTFLLPIGREHKATDLLCIDKEGNVFIIEFKLDKNQTMRDIVAQILDYASILWNESYDEFNSKIKDYLKKNYDDSDIASVFYNKFKGNIDLAEFDGDESKWKENFKEKIISKLSQGKFKLIIYANKISDDIKRVVEFLYTIYGIDIYCVEVEYYKKDDTKILVPKPFIFGKKRPSSLPERRMWDYETFIEDCKLKCDNKTTETVESLYKFIEENADQVIWGTGTTNASVNLKIQIEKNLINLLIIFSKGFICLPLYYLKRTSLSEKVIIEFLDKINKVLKQNFTMEDLNKWPSVRVSTLNQPESLNNFIETMKWLIKEIKK